MHLKNALILAASSAILLSGCGLSDRLEILRHLPAPGTVVRSARDFLSSDTRVIITNGLSDEELFRIEDTACSLQEYMVYLINLQKTYEQGFSAAFWDSSEGAALAENVRENALARIGRVKAMSLLAKDQGLALTEEEIEKAAAAAATYDASLSEADRLACGGVTPETLGHMTAEYVLADKVYRYYIRDIDPEISDDEARRVTVEQIVLRTWTYDAAGVRIDFDESEKRSLLLRARQIRREWEDGADFSELAAACNEADETELSFGRGEVDPVTENVAFSLGKDEVSDVFETGDGMTLLHMLSTFDRAETEANKLRIMDERRHEAFDKEYDSFAAGLARTFNDEVYAQAVLTDDPDVTTADFFLICEDACR